MPADTSIKISSGWKHPGHLKQWTMCDIANIEVLPREPLRPKWQWKVHSKDRASNDCCNENRHATDPSLSAESQMQKHPHTYRAKLNIYA
jgi:hypothetical protein